MTGDLNVTSGHRRLQKSTHFSAFPTLFHTAGALSAPSGHLPLEGKADDTRETCHRKPSGIAVYKNRRGASLRLSLPCMSNAIKLSRRTFLAPHRGSCPKGLCKRTGFLGVKRRENPVRRHFERSEMRGATQRYCMKVLEYR